MIVPDTAATTTIDPDALATRFRLNRAGIRNVWQYDNAMFDFADGRLLLRGKNGAGKSKALEMLLPFLLDGNTRYLDAVGQAHRTTWAWLMTDGRGPGNHVGYVWLELHAVAGDGSDRYLTLGCGIKVSTSTQRPDLWFFITDQRVGDDLPLAAGVSPWTADKLRDAVGADNVFDATGYKHRVRSLLFGGVDESRYENLLYLLHRLRQPNIGDRIDNNELPKLLAESLPPIDADTLDDVAQNLDDLDDIRDQVRRASETAAAVGEFLANYTGYARTQLRARAAAVTAACDTLAERRRYAADAEGELNKAKTERGKAETAERRLIEQLDGAKNEIASITASQAYKSLAELDDRRRLVDQSRKSAEAQDEGAAKARRREHAAVEEARRAADAAATAATRVANARADLARALRDAGIDGGLLGDDPTVTVKQDAELSETVCTTSGDESVTRPAVPAVRATGGADADSAFTALSQVTTAARRATEAVLKKGRDAAQAAADARTAQTRADELEEALGRAADYVNETRTGVESAVTEFVTELGAWRALASETSPADQAAFAHLRDVDAAQLDGETARTLLDDIRRRLSDASARAATEVGLARAAFEGLTAQRGELVERRNTVEAQPVIDPPGPAYRHPGRAGAPLFALIDFRDDVADDTRAHVEAALEASGLLTGWVTPDGHVTTDGNDIWISADSAAPATQTLAMLCVAATASDAVPREIVDQVLSTIAVDDPEHTTAVGTDGSWRLGALHGRWSKPAAEFVGAGARAAHRQRLLDELDRQIADADHAIEVAEDALDSREAHRRAIDSLPAQLPTESGIVTAEAQRVGAESRHTQARTEYAVADRRAGELRETAVRAEREFRSAATDAHLPADISTLDARLTDLARIPSLIAEARQGHGRLADALESWRAVAHRCRVEADDRRDAEERAATAIGEHEDAKQAYATLEVAVGSSGDEIRARLNDAQDRLQSAEGRLPKARTRHHKAIGDVATAEKTLEHRAAAVVDASSAVDGSVASLRRVLTIEGFARAAFGEDTAAVLDEVDAAAEADRLANLVARRAHGAGVTDNTILSRYEDLVHNLPGGLDVSPSEQHGVKLFALHDADGAHPVAVIAEQLIAEAADAESRLTVREQEVFQRFLLGNLGDSLRHHMQEAGELIRNMNAVLASVRTSHGLGVRLDWTLREDVSSPTATAKELLQIAGEIRSAAQNEELHRALQDLIDAARVKDESAGYRALLEDALDYRRWHSFTVRVIDDANPSRRQTLGPKAKLSQGEQRVLAYLTLFSAAAAQFTTIAQAGPDSPRLILLDDAFAKVDEPTHGRLLELLVELDLDFIVTSERLWGMFPGVPSLAIYECLRDPHTPGVATVEFRWDGHERHLVGL